MNLLKRLKFALTHDFDRDFIVYSIPDQMAMTFSTYAKARRFSDAQLQYKPKVMVAVSKPGGEPATDFYTPMDIAPGERV